MRGFCLTNNELSPFVTVKISREVHAQLKMICNHRRRDFADLLTEIAKLYGEVLNDLNQSFTKGATP